MRKSGPMPTNARLSLTVLLTIIGAVMITTGFAATSQSGLSTPLMPATPANFWEFAGPHAVHPIPFEVVSPDQDAVQVRFYDPQIGYEQVELDGRSFTAATGPRDGTTVRQGEPHLPFSTKLIMVRPTGQVSATVTTSSDTVVPNIDVAPKQPYEAEELQRRLDGRHRGRALSAAGEKHGWHLSHDGAHQVSQDRRDEFVVPCWRRGTRHRPDALDGGAGRSAQSLHLRPRMAGRLKGDLPPATEPIAEHQHGHARRSRNWQGEDHPHGRRRGVGGRASEPEVDRRREAIRGVSRG